MARRTGEAAYMAADEYRAAAMKRTGLTPGDLTCPREKSEMTPCVARDGRTAVAFGAFGKALCVGCEYGLDGLFEKERGLTDAGEKRDPMSNAKLIEEAARNLTKELTDKGKLIEAGFVIFAHYAVPKDAPPIQLTEMRLAFMAGAEHVFSSIMNILDPGEEPTAADLTRMDLIHREIDEWRAKLSERLNPAQGKA
jgi:hypothetical protein